MKRITIGRNPNCDIVLEDNMISRNHALLNIYPSGKYEIINMGTNGTKVNSTPISNGQPFPVKRGDSIVFAGQSALDWNLVPNPGKPLRIVLFVIAGIILLSALTVLSWWLINRDWGSKCPDNELIEIENSTAVDSTSTTVIPIDSVAVQAPTDKQSTANRFFPAKKNKQKVKESDKKETTNINKDSHKENQSENISTSTTNDTDEWHR